MSLKVTNEVFTLSGQFIACLLQSLHLLLSACVLLTKLLELLQKLVFLFGDFVKFAAAFGTLLGEVIDFACELFFLILELFLDLFVLFLNFQALEGGCRAQVIDLFICHYLSLP